MPIRFRCVGCGGVLAIARRKAGANVLCPKCSASVVVPGASTVPDPDKAEVPVRSAVAGEAVITDRKPGSNGLKKKKRKKAAPSEDMPLFERLDFESLLQPAVAKANEGATSGAPAAPPAPTPASKFSPRPVAKEPRAEPLPPPNAFIQVSRVQLIAIVVLVFCLVGLAVGVGYALGR